MNLYGLSHSEIADILGVEPPRIPIGFKEHDEGIWYLYEAGGRVYWKHDPYCEAPAWFRISPIPEDPDADPNYVDN